MGRGSPLCAKLREITVIQFKDNVSQHKIAKNLGVSPIHNSVKIFRESVEISVRKGQGQEPLLNLCDHRALRRYCLRNSHATMMDIATWARECFIKSLPLNTVCCCIKKSNLKLYYAKRKAFINFAQKRHSGLEVIWDGPKDSGNLFSGQLVFGKNRHRILRAKDEKVHPDCYQQKVQKPASVMVLGCISAHSMGDLHICEGTINAETFVAILERHMLPSRWRLFPGTPCVFQQGDIRLHSAWVSTAWLRRQRVHVLDWPACSPSWSPIENVWRITSEEIQTTATTDCWAAQVLYTPRTGKKSPCKSAAIDNFSSKMITKYNLKERCLLSDKMPLSQLFLSVFQASISLFLYI